MIYLDNNATTPVDPEVYDAVLSSLKRDTGNPSSGHLPGRRARESVESAREGIAEFLGCAAEEIVFTSGGTESNNLALMGTSMARQKGHIITSVIEHPSVSNVCGHLESMGFRVTYVPVDSSGIVDVDKLVKAVREDTFLISIMHSNNETGVLQPVEEICRVARERGIVFHVDAAQSIGKTAVGPVGAWADLVTVVSHKFYGPKGVGALYVSKGIAVAPVLFGAGHERGLRPGTENVGGIAGFGKACRLAKDDISLRVSHTSRLRDSLLKGLKAVLPDIGSNGHEVMRLPNTLNLRISGVLGYELVEKLGDGVAFSAGSACHAGRHSPSGVLKAMGLPDEDALSSVRLSVGKDNTAEEIDMAVGMIAEAAVELRKKARKTMPETCPAKAEGS